MQILIVVSVHPVSNRTNKKVASFKPVTFLLVLLCHSDVNLVGTSKNDTLKQPLTLIHNLNRFEIQFILEFQASYNLNEIMRDRHLCYFLIETAFYVNIMHSHDSSC